MNKTRQRKLVDRSIIFSITLIGVLFFMIFDFGFVYSYRIDGYRDLQWFGYWTHISNMAAFTWISLAFIAVTTDNEKLENWIQHWNIKNTVFTFIIVTGLVFIVVAYFPVVVHYAHTGNVEELMSFTKELAYDGMLVNFSSGHVGVRDVTEAMMWGQTEFEIIGGRMINICPSIIYRGFVIIGTTFKHVIIPSMFIYLAFTEIGYHRTKNIDDFNRTMIQFIWPSLYFTYVITLSSSGLISPPYSVLDYGFTQTFYEMSEMNQCIYILAALILDLMVGFIYVFVSMFQNHWNKAMCKKLGIEQEHIS